MGQVRIWQIETGKHANSKEVESDFRQAIACAVAAAEATRNTAKRYNEQFAAVQNVLAESEQKKEWRPIPSMPDCARYLLTCSPAGLQSFALARMGEVANSLKELSEIFGQAVRQKAEAELAFWLLDYRQDLVKAPSVQVRRALPGSRKMLKARKEEKR